MDDVTHGQYRVKDLGETLARAHVRFAQEVMEAFNKFFLKCVNLGHIC